MGQFAFIGTVAVGDNCSSTARNCNLQHVRTKTKENGNHGVDNVVQDQDVQFLHGRYCVDCVFRMCVLLCFECGECVFCFVFFPIPGLRQFQFEFGNFRSVKTAHTSATGVVR